jgi:lambda repressor-like predicted transcriptional regulator
MANKARKIMSETENGLPNRVHAALVLSGSSLAGWSRNKGYAMTTVWNALHGRRGGKLSQKIHTELEGLVHD